MGFCANSLAFLLFVLAVKSIIPSSRVSIKDTTQISSTSNINTVIFLCNFGLNNSDPIPSSSKNSARQLLKRQISQGIVLLKSILISQTFSPQVVKKSNENSWINFIVVGREWKVLEDFNQAIKKEKIDNKFKQGLQLTYIKTSYPNDTERLQQSSPGCELLKLFLPQILKDYDSVIYLDTDTILLKSLAKLSANFKKFRSDHVAGLVANPELRVFHGKGREKNEVTYNTGVMLMNLTRMRQTYWTEKTKILANHYLVKAKFRTQDVLVRYFNLFPQELFNVSRDWNFSPRYEIDESVKKLTETLGISLVHGANGALDTRSPGFALLFQLFKKQKLKKDLSVYKFRSKVMNALNEKKAGAFSAGVFKSLRYLQPNGRDANSEEYEATITWKNIEKYNTGNSVEIPRDATKVQKNGERGQVPGSEEIVLAITYCKIWGHLTERAPRQPQQIMVLLKSIVISKPNPKQPITVLIVTNRMSNFETVKNMMSSWDQHYSNMFKLVPLVVKYPKGYGWLIREFKPCSTLRVFYPDLIPKRYSRVIHVDTDIIFFKDLEDLWKHFHNFNETTSIASAPKLHPPPKQPSLQSGIVLMDLAQMRKNGWTSKAKIIWKILRESTMKFPDQQLLDMYRRNFPNEIQSLPCPWNYIPHYCRYSQEPCELAREEGIFGLHGVNRSFTNSAMEAVYKEIFQFYNQLDMDSTLQHKVTQNIPELKSQLLQLQGKTACSKKPEFFQNFLKSFCSSPIVKLVLDTCQNF